MSARPIRVTHWKSGRIGRNTDNEPEPGTPDQHRRRARGFRLEPAWSVIGLFGWVLFLVGGIELATTIYPPERSPEWEFATAVALVSGLPVPTMGLALILASALRRHSRRMARLAATVALLWSVAIGCGLVIFGLTVPVALRFIDDQFVRLGITKAVIKTVLEGLVYILGLATLGYQGWRRSGSSGGRSEEPTDAS